MKILHLTSWWNQVIERWVFPFTCQTGLPAGEIWIRINYPKMFNKYITPVDRPHIPIASWCFKFSPTCCWFKVLLLLHWLGSVYSSVSHPSIHKGKERTGKTVNIPLQMIKGWGNKNIFTQWQEDIKVGARNASLGREFWKWVTTTENSFSPLLSRSCFSADAPFWISQCQSACSSWAQFVFLLSWKFSSLISFPLLRQKSLPRISPNNSNFQFCLLVLMPPLLLMMIYWLEANK